MVDAGHMSGYDANYFGPTDPMTRGQLAKVAVLVAGLHTPEVEKADSPTFVDVPAKRDSEGKVIAYPFDYVEEAAAAGILSGRAGESGQVFSPGAEITRGQLAQVVARMARELKGYPADYGADGPTFSDVPDYAAADVAFTAKLGLMKGYSSGRFDVWSPAQRGHVAVVMARFLDLAPYVAPPPTTTTTTAAAAPRRRCRPRPRRQFCRQRPPLRPNRRQRRRCRPPRRRHCRGRCRHVGAWLRSSNPDAVSTYVLRVAVVLRAHPVCRPREFAF